MAILPNATSTRIDDACGQNPRGIPLSDALLDERNAAYRWRALVTLPLLDFDDVLIAGSGQLV